MWFGKRRDRELLEKLDAVLKGQEELKELVKGLTERPGGDKFQEGLENIMSFTGLRGGGEA